MTMIGFFPPVSEIIGLCIVPHMASSLLPVELDPVNDTASIPLWPARYSPISPPDPCTRFKTPSGIPASIRISTNLVAQTGV